MAIIDVSFKKLNENAVTPQYAHHGDVCMDMTAISVEYDVEKDMYKYHTGLAFESDYEIGQFLFPRSSNNKTNAYLCNSVGVADSAIYRGEIMFCYKNRTPILDVIKGMATEDAMRKSTSFLEYKENYHRFYDSLISNLEIIAMEHAPYKVGDRIGQMMFANTPTVMLHETDKLSDSVRGANGFGSTGN